MKSEDEPSKNRMKSEDDDAPKTRKTDIPF